MEELWGIPAHPLFVHLPVVLLPVLAPGAWLVAARPDWRQRWLRPLFAVSLVTMVATILAAESGGPLKEALQPGLGTRIDRHQELGEQTARLAALFFASVAVTTGADWWLRRDRTRVDLRAVGARAVQAVAVTAAVLGTLAAIWAIRTGHEGARVTWSGVEVGGG